MEKKQFINELNSKDSVESLFLVKYLSLMEARDGKEYLNMILSDSTGNLEARKWHGASEIAGKITQGDYVFIKGKINLFQNRLQLIISEISKCEEDQIDKEHFIAKATTPPERMFDELARMIEEVDDVYIRDLIKSIIFDPEIGRRLKIWPAGKTIHHAYQSGLLEHILTCTQLAVQLSQIYPVNKNYVIAGAILHDICKIYELTDGPLIEYTEEGKLLGHISKAVEILEHFTGKIRNFPHRTKIHLKHIMLSHHGEHEFGSPLKPLTSEALLVHQIDLIDSKMNSFETAKKSDKGPGNWTNYSKHLDRIIYKNDLPYFNDYLEEEVKQKNERVEKKENPSRNSGELKQSMGAFLKDFKVK